MQPSGLSRASNMVVQDYIFVTCADRIEKGYKYKKELLEDFDWAAVISLQIEQIKIVGGETIFNHLDGCFKAGVIDFNCGEQTGSANFIKDYCCILFCIGPLSFCR